MTDTDDGRTSRSSGVRALLDQARRAYHTEHGELPSDDELRSYLFGEPMSSALDLGGDVDPNGASVEVRRSARESTRRTILVSLAALLSAVMIGYFIVAAVLPADRFDQVNNVADKLATGIIGLIGVAIGYYFTHSRDE